MFAKSQRSDGRSRRTPTESGSRRRLRDLRPWPEALEGRALLALFPGNPIAVVPTPFSGVGATTGARTALTSFQTAIGGVNNGGAAPAQVGSLSTGFRVIDWDAVQLNGTDFGGGANTTTIVPNQTIGIPLNRFQARGVSFDEVYAVSGNGFAGLGTNVNATTFPAFSPSNTFAAINDNTIELSFVLSSSPTSAPVPAATRGFGAIFIGNQGVNTSSIQYF